MAKFPYQCLDCMKKAWREFRARKVTVMISKEPETIITPSIPKKPAKDSGSIYLSRGGVQVSEEYLDGDSHTYEIIPLSGQQQDLGLCILLPWYWQGYVEHCEIVSKERTHVLIHKTREVTAQCYRLFPNGARVFLRTEERETGEQIGRGTLRVRDRDGTWWNYSGNFSEYRTGWQLKHASLTGST